MSLKNSKPFESNNNFTKNTKFSCTHLYVLTKFKITFQNQTILKISLKHNSKTKKNISL